MRQFFLLSLLLGMTVVLAGAGVPDEFVEGNPEIQSMSTLEFGPDGILFIGDSKAGAVFAVDTQDRTPFEDDERVSIHDIEGRC